jgi:hypothetical protein
MIIPRNETLRELKFIQKIGKQNPPIEMVYHWLKGLQQAKRIKRQADKLFGKHRKTL